MDTPSHVRLIAACTRDSSSSRITQSASSPRPTVSRELGGARVRLELASGPSSTSSRGAAPPMMVRIISRTRLSVRRGDVGTDSGPASVICSR